jgi:ATP-dependent DNA helicase RecG
MIDLSSYKRLELTEAEVRRYLDEEEGPYYDRKSLWDRSGPTLKVRDRSTVREEIAEYLAAFANADGGLLILGVEDDGTPTGHGYPEEAILSFLRAAKEKVQPPLSPRAQIISIDGKELLLFEIESAPEAVLHKGRCPYRTGDQVVNLPQEVINGLKKTYQLVSFEQRPRPEFMNQDLDLELARKVFSRTPFRDRPLEENFIHYGLAVRRNGKLIWRNAGILLFGREEQFASFHPRTGVRVFRVEGKERKHGRERNVIEQRFEGPLPSLLDKVRDHIRTLVRKSEKLHDLFFKEMPEYPEFAWQEALINAVAHRDYAITTREIEVSMFDDRMEVKSPGGLVEGITLERLRERRSNIHASRNPLLVRVLVDYGLMREEGEGIPRMMEEMETSFLHLPELELINGDFQVRLKNIPIFEVGSSEWVNFVKGLPITDRQRRVLIAKGKGGFTNQDYKKLNQLDRDTAYQEIKTMLDAGIIESRGKTRGTKYFLSLTVTRIVTLILGRLPKLREFLEGKESISNGDYRTLFNLTRRQARDELKALCDKGYLILVGERRGAKYQKGPTF